MTATFHGGAAGDGGEPVRPASPAFGGAAYAPWGMALTVAAGVALLTATPAAAVEHTLVRWKKTGQCEIVTRLPLWGDHWVVLGGYPSKLQAEQALSKLRRTKACPASKAAKRAEKPPEQHKPPVTKQTDRPLNMLW